MTIRCGELAARASRTEDLRGEATSTTATTAAAATATAAAATTTTTTITTPTAGLHRNHRTGIRHHHECKSRRVDLTHPIQNLQTVQIDEELVVRLHLDLRFIDDFGEETSRNSRLSDRSNNKRLGLGDAVPASMAGRVPRRPKRKHKRKAKEGGARR